MRQIVILTADCQNPANMNYHNDCAGCNERVFTEKYIVSCNKDFGVTLCYSCLKLHKNGLRKSAKFANRLFFTLRARNIDAKLAVNDGFKTVDIYIEKSRLHIEVDGEQHNLNESQALSDLKRTFHSLEAGYFTLRIPNSLVKMKLKETAKFIIYIIDLMDQTSEKAVFRRA